MTNEEAEINISRTYGTFISHAWTYHGEYYRLVNLFFTAPYFRFHEFSVPLLEPDDPRDDASLERSLRDQVRLCSTAIIVSDIYVRHPKWVQMEIDIAVEMSKPIIGLTSLAGVTTPPEVLDVAKEVVGWDTESIVAAIRKHAIDEPHREFRRTPSAEEREDYSRYIEGR